MGNAAEMDFAALLQPPRDWAAGVRATRTYGERVTAVVLASLVGAVYLQLFAKRLPPGGRRLAALLPLLALNFFLPLLFSDADDELLSRTIITFTATWLGQFKLLALAMGRGPLRPRWSLLQLEALYLLPLFPKQEGREAGRLGESVSKGHLLRMWAVNTSILLLSAFVLFHYHLPEWPRYVVNTFGLMGFLCLTMDGPGALVSWLFGVNVCPNFDCPWLSTSVGDWWGRRWNMPTSALLRTVVYDPIVEGSLVARNSGDAVAPPPAGAPAPAAAAAAAAAERRAAATAAAASDVASAKAGGTRDDTGADAVSTPKLHAAASGRDAAKTGNGSSSGKAAAGKPRVSELRKAIGAMATFAVSGLIHEMVLLYIQPVASNGKWFTFFAIYGPITVLELKLKRWCKAHGWQLPQALQILVTLSFLTLIAGVFFFPPVEKDSRLAERVIRRVTENGRDVSAALLAAVRRATDGQFSRGDEL